MHAPDSLFGPTLDQQYTVSDEKTSSIFQAPIATLKHHVGQKTKPNVAVRGFKRFIGIPEDEPETVHATDYLKGSAGSAKSGAVTYVRSLFPFLNWLPRYNLTWLTGDLIA